MKALVSINKLINTKARLFVIAAVAIAASLYLRMGDLAFINNSLWAEDGNVFITHATTYGIESLWMSYAGYLLLYLRIFALIADIFPLSLTPLIFFMAWLIAFSMFAWIAITRLTTIGVSFAVAVFFILLISLQPASGEVYFTLTNAQWWIGAALIIYLLMPESENAKTRPPNAIQIIFVLLACLTGPFSILLIPGLIVRLFLLQDFGKKKALAHLALACALSQLAVFLTSERFTSNEVDYDIFEPIEVPIDWAEALGIFFTFGSSNALVIVTAIIFWAAFAYSVTKILILNNRPLRASGATNVLLVILTALLIYAAGLYAVKDMPQRINPLLDGSRYFVVPYTLLFFSTAVLYLKSNTYRDALLIPLIVLSVSSFKPIQRDNLHYQAYAAFAKYNPHVVIPINPVWNNLQAQWRILPGRDTLESTSIKHNIDFNSVTLYNASINSRKPLVFDAPNNDPQLVIRAGSLCKNSKYIGVEIELSRSKTGPAQIFWATSPIFSEEHSFKRCYPSYFVPMHFAFPNPGDPLFIRFDPFEYAGKVNIESIAIYCL